MVTNGMLIMFKMADMFGIYIYIWLVGERVRGGEVVMVGEGRGKFA